MSSPKLNELWKASKNWEMSISIWHWPRKTFCQHCPAAKQVRSEISPEIRWLYYNIITYSLFISIKVTRFSPQQTGLSCEWCRKTSPTPSTSTPNYARPSFFTISSVKSCRRTTCSRRPSWWWPTRNPAPWHAVLHLVSRLHHLLILRLA